MYFILNTCPLHTGKNELIQINKLLNYEILRGTIRVATKVTATSLLVMLLLVL